MTGSGQRTSFRFQPSSDFAMRNTGPLSTCTRVALKSKASPEELSGSLLGLMSAYEVPLIIAFRNWCGVQDPWEGRLEE